jgi:hypothetical protein
MHEQAWLLMIRSEKPRSADRAEASAGFRVKEWRSVAQSDAPTSTGAPTSPGPSGRLDSLRSVGDFYVVSPGVFGYAGIRPAVEVGGLGTAVSKAYAKANLKREHLAGFKGIPSR